jgi:hypothetical protein
VRNARRLGLLIGLVLVGGCEEPSLAPDASALIDASVSRDAGAHDAAREIDAGPSPLDALAVDGGAPVDAPLSDDVSSGSDATTQPDAFASADAFSPPDAFASPDAFSPPDAFVPADAFAARVDTHVHIEVDNTCRMTVTPREATALPGQTLYFDWHNHSRDYPVDVWMSYGGGYTDLATGATWDEPIGHCSTPFVGDEYADITTACSSFRFLIHCR